MLRWCGVIVMCLLAMQVWAEVEITDLPEKLGDRYDLTWQASCSKAPAGALVLGIEEAKGKGGYRLQVEKGVASWEKAGSREKPATASLKLEAGKTVAFTFKRRPGTMALLQDHRLVFCAPAPAESAGTLAFRQVPAGMDITEARYLAIEPPRLGDDFMRPEGLRIISSGVTRWVEDDTWKVAYYRKDNPATDPKDPKTSLAMTNPWQLSLYPTVQMTTNGFWYVYRGVGPSWVVANPTMVYPSADDYFVEAAVRPEYDSEVGVIAAYQDQKNYLLFRWRQWNFGAEAGTPRAQLIAVIDGAEKVLASSPYGFHASQWYTMRINLGWQRVQVLINGTPVLDAENPGCVEGRVGLYANGAEAPRRPKVDDVTASMYVSTDKDTGKVINEAADALRTTSWVLFDDVRVGEWVSLDRLSADSPYALDGNGNWKVTSDQITPASAGHMLTGDPGWSCYRTGVQVMIRPGSSAGVYLHMNASNSGYLWVLNEKYQQLVRISKGEMQSEVDRSSVGLAPGKWADLRIEADGPYVALFCNDQQVLAGYDRERTAGRCGLYASSTGTTFRRFDIALAEPKWHKLLVHENFDKDKWLVTWSSAEADWYPAFTPKNFVTPAGMPHKQVGAAAPLPTDQPGLYWHKGGHYHDLRAIIPVSRDMFAGQILHLSTNYQPEAGYRLQFDAGEGNSAKVTLLRKDKTVGNYTFTFTDKSRLIFERRGPYLLLLGQDLDPEDTSDNPLVAKETEVFAYRDREPIAAEMIGFTVTNTRLPAANVVVQSDRMGDTFEKAPVDWTTESGVWAVMARYSCDPKWNWFGGFGVNTPTVWSRYKLDGDQNVEVYLGIKMQFDNATEEYSRRYRDVNLSICSDGSHLNSGYSVIRAGRIGNRVVTMLLRKNVVVKTSTAPDDQLPPQGQGHRQWFATRIEKRGGELKVFLDNRLVMTYVDPEPLTGGYVGIWTLNNGIMIGRTNLSADRMTIGFPRAAEPLAIQENLDPLPVGKVTLNGTPLTIASFENGFDDWKERPGMTGRLVRERVVDPAHGPNTYLKVVNTYPAGDFSVNATTTSRNLATTPILHLDYCFDPGVQLNLYLHVQQTWYEFLLTGKEAQEANLYTAGRISATADGKWHHLEANLGQLLTQAIAKQTGTQPTDLNVQEIVFADWSTSADVRPYGFCANPGKMAVCFDNMVLAPAVNGPVNLAWSAPSADLKDWRTGVDAQPMGGNLTDTTSTTLTVPAPNGTRFFHLQLKGADGKPGATLQIPLTAAR